MSKNTTGVDWSMQYGAECPFCGYFIKFAYRHMPWRDNIKIRYHRCQHCSQNFKSIAIDLAALDYYPQPA
jgi:hypothetical protein